MPSSLTTWLLTNPPIVRADLFSIALPTGATLNVCDAQFDITVPSGTPGWSGATTDFYASQYGKWSRGPITSEAGFSLSANGMSLTCVAQQGTLYPGLDAGILGAAWQGLFDACTVNVWTCYMPLGNWGFVGNGIETKFLGFIDGIEHIDRVHVKFHVLDPFFLLNEKIPRRLIQAACPWNFCDSNCTLAAANFTVAFTAGAASTQQTLVPSAAFAQAVGYFTQGVVTCTAGKNAGLSQTVKLHDSSGNLELVTGFILPVAAGDTFTALKGCDKTYATCAAQTEASGTIVNNSVNYGGTPAVPAPTNAI